MSEERDTPWDPEHLEILKKGMDVWNAWRADNPTVNPDLKGVNLREANLRKHNLNSADFSRADLSGADLREASMNSADLFDANLGGADLSQTSLSMAKLYGARLTSARLFSARLFWADLRNAKLNKADLRTAWIGGTRLDTQTLGDAIGLDQLKHASPSPISPTTLKECATKLPDSFLRGIGFTNWEVLAIKLRDPNLRPDQVTDIGYKIIDMRTNSPIQTNSIFFSYSSKDVDFVETIEKRFNEDHINSWRDVHEISAGPIEAQLERAINLNGTVLLVLSENSVNSEWVLYEVRKARKLKAKLDAEKKKPTHVLCPVALDDSWKNCAWPPRIREDLEDYHILDCSDWKEDSFNEKYEKLKTNLGIYYFGQDKK